MTNSPSLNQDREYQNGTTPGRQTRMRQAAVPYVCPNQNLAFAPIHEDTCPFALHNCPDVTNHPGFGIHMAHIPRTHLFSQGVATYLRQSKTVEYAHIIAGRRASLRLPSPACTRTQDRLLVHDKEGNLSQDAVPHVCQKQYEALLPERKRTCFSQGTHQKGGWVFPAMRDPVYYIGRAAQHVLAQWCASF